MASCVVEKNLESYRAEVIKLLSEQQYHFDQSETVHDHTAATYDGRKVPTVCVYGLRALSFLWALYWAPFKGFCRAESVTSHLNNLEGVL